MFCLLFTVPADRNNRKTGIEKNYYISSKQKYVTFCLIVIWVILIAFGTVSALKPEWFQRFSRMGIDAESLAYKNYGDNLVRQRNYRLALSQYQCALEIKPGFTNALINMAVAYSQLGDWNKAYKILKGALREGDVEQGVVCYNIGELLEKQKKFEESIVFYQKALNYQIKKDKIYSNLGKLYMALKDYENANTAFKNALDCHLNPFSAYLDMLRNSLEIFKNDEKNLTIIIKQLEDDMTADILEPYDVEFMRQLQNNSPEIARTHNFLALINIQQGNLDSAEQHFDESLRILPGNKDAVKNLELLRKYKAKEKSVNY